MNERVTRELTTLALGSAPQSLVPAHPAPQTSYDRSGSNNWNLWTTPGFREIKSVSPFPTQTTSYLGVEGTSGPDKVGVSRYDFSEGVQYVRADDAISLQLPNGTVQKITGQVPIMLSGIQLWSGQIKVKDSWEDTPASANYNITQTIRRQNLKNYKFHLVILPVQPAYKGQDVGHNSLQIWQDPDNKLLRKKDLLPGADLWLNCEFISEISDWVNEGEFLRVEVIAELRLSNSHSRVESVTGGSYCGAGFLDNA
jgi:hypothetical protein